MSLTAEQKARILEEEKHRLAEEQYREQVREELRNSEFSPPVFTPPTPPRPVTPPASHLGRNILVFIGIVVVLCAAYLLTGNALYYLVSHPSATEAPNASASSGNKTSGTSRKPVSPAETPVKLTTEQIAEVAKPSVVVIRSFGPDNQPIGQGSGYIYSANGIVVTNYHVIRGASSVQIQSPSKGGLHAEAILGYSPEHDVAALAVTEGSLPILEAQSSGEIHVGDRVIAIGAPLGLDNTVTEGIVSARRDMGSIELIQTSAAISPGSSGGPLINEYGRVIGLNTQKRIGGENLNFAVPVRYLSELLAQQRRMSFSEMLDETHVVNRFSSNTFTVPPRQINGFTFSVEEHTGATLAGTFDVSGGNRDVTVLLTNINGALLANMGRVNGEGRISQHLPPGQYKLIFDNRFSFVTAKSVTPDLAVEYYK